MEQPLNTPDKATSPKIAKIVIKALKRTIITIALLLLGVVCMAFIVTYFYEDKVKQFAIAQMNSYLNTPVYIDPQNIDFTLFSNFPAASVNFKDLKALEVTNNQKKETLFRAGKISFVFSLTDIFSKSYKIKNIEISDVDLNLKVDENGNDNYHFLKLSADTAKNINAGAKSGFNVRLDKIILNDIRIKYLNKQRQQYYAGIINKADFSGNFSTEQYKLATVAAVFIQVIREKNTNLITEKPCDLDLMLLVDKKTHTIQINKGTVKLAGVGVALTGNVISQSSKTDLNLTFKGDDIDIYSLLSLIPASYQKNISNYKSTGNFYINGTVKGSYSENTDPIVHADFGIKRGTLSSKKTAMALENIILQGQLLSGKTNKGAAVKINKFSATLGKGNISGNFKIDNLNEPYITANTVANFQLDELHKFITIDTISTIAGAIQANVTFSAKLKPNSKYTAEDYARTLASGTIHMNGVTMKLKHNPLDFRNINGFFTFKQNELAINTFSGNISNSDFELNGILKNVLAFLFAHKETLTVNANLTSNSINLNELLADKNETVIANTSINNSTPVSAGNAATNNGTSPAYNLRFSNYLNLALTSNIKHIAFRKFNAYNLSGTVELQDQQLRAKDIQLETMDGTVSLKGLIDANNEHKLTVGCNAQLNNLNIQKMFTQFENFGQTYLVDKNIKGAATAAIQFSAACSPSLEVDKSSIFTRCDLTIENGALNAFKPLLDLGKDLEKDIILRELIDVPEFRNKVAAIRFKTFKNFIEIKNQKITFSTTEIKSSAMNIDFFGSHNFNKQIDYHFSFYLPQLLTLQAKKRKEQNKEFGEEQDDGLGRVLHYYMTGTTDKPLFKRDLKAEKARRKENKKKEKENLKGILHEEFGLFKKDTAVNNKSKKPKAVKKENNFKVNWGDKNKENKDTDKEDDF